MLDALSFAFFQRALIAGVLVGMVTSYYGVFVVQRGLAFMGNGLAHAAFGGVALALLLQKEPLWVALPFTVIVALLITWARERTKLSADTVIGVFFALSMALGIVFISQTSTFQSDAMTYLFGSIISVTKADVLAAAGILALTAATLPLWGGWAYGSFDRESAQADGVPVRRNDYLLAVLLAVTVVVASKIVGIVLLSAFLVIPAAAARLISRRFAAMTVASVLLGSFTAVAGIFASDALDWPSGATIILLQSVVFAACWGIGNAAAKTR